MMMAATDAKEKVAAAIKAARKAADADKAGQGMEKGAAAQLTELQEGGAAKARAVVTGRARKRSRLRLERTGYRGIAGLRCLERRGGLAVSWLEASGGGLERYPLREVRRRRGRRSRSPMRMAVGAGHVAASKPSRREVLVPRARVGMG